MTNGILEPHHPIDVSPEGLQRVIDLSRRALRAQDASLLPPESSESTPIDEQGATLAARVTTEGTALATLVVTDAPGRSWSDDDRAMLDDLAAILASEVRLRGERSFPPPFVARDISATEATAEEPGGSAEWGQASADGALRILLADDLDLNRKLICDMLSVDGYLVDSVADGAAAVEAVKAKSYDLVLMDMIMPGMDGMDATRAIRALPAPLCDVPIVALTAHSFREQLDNCLHAGMNATLTKPMSFDSLSAAVSTWARGRQAA